SSRRRHTRFSRDWSSDVCSSDLDDLVNESLPKRIEETLKGDFFADEARRFIDSSIDDALARPLPDMIGNIETGQLDRLKAQITRSEERRVGKEWRGWWTASRAEI